MVILAFLIISIIHSFNKHLESTLLYFRLYIESIQKQVRHPKEFLWVFLNAEINVGASLAAQWLRIRLPMRGTQVRALVREDPTCLRATKPMHHSY